MLTNLCHTIWNADFLQGITVAKSILSNRCNAIGKRDLNKLVAILKGSSQGSHGHALNRCGNRDFSGISHVVNGDRFTVLSVVNNAVLLNRIGGCRGIDDLASKTVCGRVCICIAILIAPNRQLGAACERVCSNAYNAIGQDHGIEIITTRKCLVTDRCERLVGYDTNQRIGIIKCLLADLGDPLC